MFLVALISLLAITKGSTVKFFVNDCMEDLFLKDYHNYTGKIVTPPPQIIKQNSSVLLFEYEYAAKEEYGSLLDGNINYYPYSSATFFPEFHIFVNINTTGGLYLSIQAPFVWNGSACMDVDNNGGVLPSVVGIYSWFVTNQTETQCQLNTPLISDCKHVAFLSS